MKLTIDISQKTLDDLTVLADYHAVLIEDVIRHYITEGIEAEKVQQLGPWETVSREEAKRPLPPDVLIDALQDTVHTEVGRSRVAGAVRRVK